MNLPKSIPRKFKTQQAIGTAVVMHCGHLYHVACLQSWADQIPGTFMVCPLRCAGVSNLSALPVKSLMKVYEEGCERAPNLWGRVGTKLSGIVVVYGAVQAMNLFRAVYHMQDPNGFRASIIYGYILGAAMGAPIGAFIGTLYPGDPSPFPSELGVKSMVLSGSTFVKDEKVDRISRAGIIAVSTLLNSMLFFFMANWATCAASRASYRIGQVRPLRSLGGMCAVIKVSSQRQFGVVVDAVKRKLGAAD